MELFPWREENRISRDDIDSGHIIPSLSACHTSVVEDGGDAQQLAQHSSTYSERPDGSQAEIERNLIDNKSLEGRLRDAMANSIGHDSRQQSFVPVDDLDNIINANTIRSELEKLNIVSIEDLGLLIDQICGIHKGKSPQDGKITITTRRRIFATLILIQHIPAIIDVIEEGLYDWDLPLSLDGSCPSYPRLTRKGTSDKHEDFNFSKTWSCYLHQAFFNCQWQLLSPYIGLRAKSDAKINHYPLGPDIILPIIKISGPERRGGFGNVSKIQIHQAHRNLLSNSPGSWLALKRLRNTSEQAFRAEVGPLKRLGKDNPHVIQLLATFKYREEYYLLFEWADGGNLDQFFQSHPQADSPPRDAKLSQWLASQILGLSDALASIHECEPDPLAANMSDFNSNEIRKKYGSHGDVKPENILFFGEDHSEDQDYSLGTFKISDFGLASFHGLESRRKFRPEGISLTYRAPEYDMDGCVSQQYDLWSFGCVLSELMTWYLLGGDAVNKFRIARREDTRPSFTEDIFFSVDKHPENSDIGRATEKRAVLEQFNMLQNHSGCTDFLLDLIDLVDTRLLRMSPDHRCHVHELRKIAAEMNKRTHEDVRYCLERLQPIKSRQRTNLSELLSRPLSPPGARRIGTTSATLEINKPDPMAAHQKAPSSDALSPVREVVTPITSQSPGEANGQHGVRPSSMSNPGDTKEDEIHSKYRDFNKISASTSQGGLDTRYPGTVDPQERIWAKKLKVLLSKICPASFSDGTRGSDIEGSDPGLADKVLNGEVYSVSDDCFGMGVIWWGKIRAWSAFLRK
ncbi:kinase-like domain-containing protein [Nemania sp. FL0916]|nr:kinase-like domain-containing protein [Nemania sp. FL0916]